ADAKLRLAARGINPTKLLNLYPGPKHRTRAAPSHLDVDSENGALLSKRPDSLSDVALLNRQSKRSEMLHAARGADHENRIGARWRRIPGLNRRGRRAAVATAGQQEQRREQGDQQERSRSGQGPFVRRSHKPAIVNQED